jgi:hypothetical protein
MKKAIFLSFIINCFQSTFAQIVKTELPKEIEVGKVKSGTSTKATLSFTKESNKDTLYTLLYNDMTYTKIDVFESVSFYDKGNTLNDFYNILIQALNEEKDKETTFKIGETNVVAITKKMLGTKYLYISFSKKNGGSGLTNLNKKEIKKLFHREDAE